MKTLPSVKNDFSQLVDLALCGVKTKLLMTACDMEIFDHLQDPIAAHDLAERLDTNPDNTRLLLDGLTSMGLLEKQNSQYRDSALAEEFLVRGKDTCLLGMITSPHMKASLELADLPELVKNGPPPREDLPELDEEETWAESAWASANNARAGMAQIALGIVSELPGYHGFKRMLDLGGGSGMAAIAMVGAHPSLEAVVFDQPPVVKVAEHFIAEYELTERISVMAGNYAIDDIGHGYDLIWASFTLNFFRADLVPLLTKLRQALNPGGVLVAFQDSLTHERTQPANMILWGLAYALHGQDMLFNKGEIAAAMGQAGFKAINSATQQTPHGPLGVDMAWAG